MWCRVLLIIVALTCTFQREITTDTDDLLCVLILSGIQKEDLDVNLLKKLQRHNVNIDNLSNRKTIENCFLGSTKKRDINETASTTKTIITTNDVSENIKSSYLRIYDLISYPEKENISTYENNTNLNMSELGYNKTDRPISKLINSWVTYEKLNQENFTEEFRNSKPLPIGLEKEAEIVSRATDLAFFHNVVETYSSLPHVTTTEPSTAEKPRDIVSQQIMKFLKNRYIHQNERSYDHVSGETKTEIPKARKSTQKKIELAVNTDILQETGNNYKDKNRSYNNKNIIDLWIAINKTNVHSEGVDKTTKKSELEMSISKSIAKDKYSKNSKPSDLDFINKILSYIASQQSATTERTTLDKHAVSIHQLIRKFLQNNNALQDKTLSLLQEPIPSVSNTKLNTDKLTHIQHTNHNMLSKPISHSNVFNQTHVLDKSNLSDNQYSYKSQKMENGEIIPEAKYIGMLEAYFARKSAALSIQQAAAKDKHIDIILQEIKKFLENKDKHLVIPKLSRSYEMSSDNTRNDSDKPEMQLPAHSDEIEVNSYSEFFDMSESYIATTPDVITISISPEVSKEIYTIAQKVKEYFEKNGSSGKPLVRPDRGFKINKIVGPKTKTINNINQLTTVTHGTSYMDLIKKHGQQLRMTDSVEFTPETARFNKDSQMGIAENFNDSVKGIITEPNPLQEDIIKEITEKVKASVLKDLEIQIPIKIKTIRDTTASSSTTDAAVKTIRNLYATTGIPRVKKRKEPNNVTEKPGASNTSVPQIKSDMKNMAEFFELFQQLKNMKNGMTTPATKNNIEHNQKPTNGDQGATHAVFPSLLPMYSDNKRTRLYNQHVISYVKPYHDFQMPKPIMQQTRTKITNEIREVRYGDHKATKHPISIIQTDAFQVPLLAIPVSHSNIPLNQNIILTTQSPIKQFKNIYEHNLHTKKPKQFHELASRIHRTYSTERLTDRSYVRMSNTGHTTDTETDRSFDIEELRYHSDIDRRFRRHKYIHETDEPRYSSHIDRGFRRRQKYTPQSRHFGQEHKSIRDIIRHHSRDRESSLVHRDSYKEYLDTRPKSDVWDLIRSSPEHKYERFHEKLERPEQWPSDTRDTQNIAPKEQRKVNVASRQQVSLNEFKVKKSLYDDDHFLNFLQRQKKVNDMLESILAQKSDRIRSVETPDTIG